jgi:hypothetical protein
MRKDWRASGLHWTIDPCETATGWTVLGNDTINLAAITTRRVKGAASLEFDKTNGAAGTIYAGAYKTLDVDLSQNVDSTDEIGWFLYVSSKANVAYSFLRIGTSASHYVEFQFPDELIVAGQYTFCHVPLGEYSSITGNGVNWTNVDYVAVGTAHDAESDALADISIDEIGIWPNLAMAAAASSSASIATDESYVDGTAYQDATGTPIVSPDTDVGTTPVALTIPSTAKYLYLRATAAIRYGSNATLDGTGTGKGYMYLPAYEMSPPIPVQDAVAVYVRIDASSGTCSVYQEWEKD